MCGQALDDTSSARLIDLDTKSSIHRDVLMSVCAAHAIIRKLKIFLVELAMGWASQKHSVALDPNWKLPKTRYKGDKVLPQCLRLDRKPVSGSISLTAHSVRRHSVCSSCLELVAQI